MKHKVTNFESDGLYMVLSKSSANTLYFENRNDHQLFMTNIDKYLGSMIEIVHYAIIPTGWVLIFRTRNEKKIRSSYFKQRMKSQKVKIGLHKKTISHMISEHFRFAISQFVRTSNFINNRNGSKIHSRINKFILPSVKALAEEVEKLENLVNFNEQYMARYRPDYSYYNNEGMEGMNHELKSAKKMGSILGDGFVVSCLLRCYRRVLLCKDVVRRLIKRTLNTHFNSISPIFSPP